MIQRRGDRWRVLVYAGKDPLTGKERRISRTLPKGATKTEANQLERRLKVEVAGGAHRTPNVTVAELLAAWLDHAAPDLSPTTLHSYRGYIDREIIPELGKVRLAKLTTAQHDRLYRRLRDSGGRDGQGLAPATIRQIHAILRRALRQAQRWGWIEKNPAELATLPPARRPQHTIPTPAQVGDLVEAARAVEEAHGLAIWLAAVTGVRRGELCGLRWPDVDLDGRALTVDRSVVDIAHRLVVKDTKTHQARRVAIDDVTVGWLRDHRRAMAERALAFGASLHPDAYVLSESADGAEPLHPNLVSDRFRRVVRRAGIECRFHDLRHWHVTYLLAAGIPVRQVADRVGHASAKMTLDQYGHAIAEQDRAAAEAAAGALAR